MSCSRCRERGRLDNIWKSMSEREAIELYNYLAMMKERIKSRLENENENTN